MEQQNEFLQSLIDEFGDTATSKQILDFAESKGLPVPHFILRNDSMKYARGKYRLCSRAQMTKPGSISHAISTTLDNLEGINPNMTISKQQNVTPIASKRALNITESFVPERMKEYVPFGFYNDLKGIIKSKVFYPVYITGHSGNGKTLMIEQVCAELGRELIRTNITKRTDESDLIGSYELIDGNTIRREGPVLTAMRRGAILLLDEIDLGTEDLLCLQPIMEGKAYFDKRTGEVIHPATGFNIIATANTKGKGDSDGRYLGTNIMNEAMLERFAMTEEQNYPDKKTEMKILTKNFETLGVVDNVFVERLVTWAEVIRNSFINGAVDEIISTRRLVHITKAFVIFDNNRMKAIEKCLNGFDTETKTVFLDLYTKVDAEAASSQNSNKIGNPEFDGISSALSGKYNTSVVLYHDISKNCVVVEAFGRSTAITKMVADSAIDFENIVDETVNNHKFLSNAGVLR